MELRNIKSFIKVAEFENFSKAAEILGYAQSTLTIQIQQLEEELGVVLFDRIGKRIRLSEKGTAFLAYAYQLVKIESESLEAMSDSAEVTGFLRVGIIETMSASLFPPILKEYLKTYPSVSLEIKMGTVPELLDQLEKGLLDVILVLDRPIFRPALETVFSEDSEIYFFAAPEHPFAGQEAIPLTALQQENFLLTEKNCNYRYVFDEYMAANQIEIHSNLESGIAASIIDLAAEGMGIAILPDYCLQTALQEKKISTFTVAGCAFHMQIQMLRHQQKWVSLAMRHFFEIAEKHFRQGISDKVSEK